MKKINLLSVKRTGIITIILTSLLTISCFDSKSKSQIIASGLGNVYGIELDQNGNIFATGSDEQGALIWKISPDGTQSVYCRIDDPAEALSAAGISVHSKYITQLTIDHKGYIWLSTSLYGAGFIVTGPDSEAIKLYLNMNYTVSLLDDDFPFGVTFDKENKKILLITNGPASTYSTENKHYIHSISFDEAKNDYEGLFTGSNDRLFFTKNEGIEITEMARDLIAHKQKIILIGESNIFEVNESGQFNTIGENPKSWSFWSGTSDDNGNIYLTANTTQYQIGEDGSQGGVYMVTSSGKYKLLTSAVKEPLGIAYNKGYIYITDRSNGSIVKMKL